MSSLDDLRQQGNYAFAHGDYDAAVSLYSAAIAQAEESEAKDALIVNLSNRSAAEYQRENYQTAREDAERAYRLSDQANLKAAYRLAKTLAVLKEYDSAKKIIQASLQQLLELDSPSATSSSSADANQPSPAQQRQALEDLWKQVIEAALETNKPQPTEHSIKFVQRHVSIKEFTKGEELGYGNFSDICIVTHKVTGERFALKSIEKKKAADLAKRQHPNVYNEISMERRILLERLPPSPHIIHMYHAFQDYNTLYYLMELHDQWSDLWSELKHGTKMVGCHRSSAKVWMAELIDALEHMHRHGIVHRDLKPENILLNRSGHVIVIDFGTAKDLIQPDLNGPEFVGTPDFMSPEAVNGTSGMQEAIDAVKKGELGVNHAADLWALGAILYILETGMTPFWSPSPYLAFLRIKRCLLRRPVGVVDDDSWDLISSLMQSDPSQRLGADAFELIVDGRGRRIQQAREDGYDCIRSHPYFAPLQANPAAKTLTPVPSLLDLCYRAVADQVQQEALDFELTDRHPPGDGSRHDMMRLKPRDRAAVLHILDRCQQLREPRLYARFFTDTVACRLDKVRPETRDFVGLTAMNDDQYKPPKALLDDPYAKPISMSDIKFVYLTSPLFVKELNVGADEAQRKEWIKLLKKSIAAVNRSRPTLVIVTGFVDEKCRRLLARVNETIPVVVGDGSAFFTFWTLGVQCIALQSSSTDESSEQVAWLREQMEVARMSKHPLFVFADGDPRQLPMPLVKRLVRGRALALFGSSVDKEPVLDSISYTANETFDDGASIRSTDSVEDDKDEFTTQVVVDHRNGLRTLTVDDEPDSWRTVFTEIGLE